jgi:hypothetical protein
LRIIREGKIRYVVDALLDPSGDDCNLLTSDEKHSEDKSRVSYTDDDKMILWQFEGAATPAEMFSKFLQDRRNAPPYVLLEARMAIQSTSSNSFAIVSGKYCVGWLGCWSVSCF